MTPFGESQSRNKHVRMRACQQERDIPLPGESRAGLLWLQCNRSSSSFLGLSLKWLGKGKQGPLPIEVQSNISGASLDHKNGRPESLFQ